MENKNKKFGADKTQVKQMFNAIAEDYDKLNHILTLNIDKIWRRKLVKLISTKKYNSVLDIACGTGDLSVEFLKNADCKVVAIDISEKMIEKCKNKVLKLKLNKNFDCLLADVHQMPFQDNSFDVVSVSFGFRNFEDQCKSLNEITRVLKIGGRLVIMEFYKSELMSKNIFFRFYLQKVIPFLGKIISGHKWAYSYLFSSIEEFLTQDEFVELLINHGFTNVQKKKLMFGAAYIVVGELEFRN